MRGYNAGPLLRRGLLGGIAAFLGFLWCADAGAESLAYDPFNYAAGSNLAGQGNGSGFAGPWSTNGSYQIQSGLTYPGLPTSGGSVVSGGTDGAWIAPNFAIGTDSTTLYFSWLTKPGSGNADYAGLALDTGAPHGAFIGFNNSAYPQDGFEISDTSGNNPVASDVPALQGQTYLLVLKAEFLPGNDRLTLYVDPPLTGAEPTAGTVDTGIDVGQPSVIAFYTSGTQSFDELRVGTSFADVVGVAAPLPAPASGGLVLLACLGGVMIVRRRARRA